VRGAGLSSSAMAHAFQQQLPQLLDLRALGAYLGRPWRTLERQLVSPPPGFPAAVRLGRRVFWPRVQIDAWLAGSPALAPHAEAPAIKYQPPSAPKRPRGRPRKVARSSATDRGA
jgi:predicted DNA-binding transcriptional regulator AlpA